MLMRLLEVMAHRLGDEHGGVTVTVQEGVPPMRLSRQQVSSRCGSSDSSSEGRARFHGLADGQLPGSSTAAQHQQAVDAPSPTSQDARFRRHPGSCGGQCFGYGTCCSRIC